MITRNIIDIPNHPILTDVVRKAQIFRSHKEYDTNRVILKVLIFHYDKNGNQIKYLPGGTENPVELISDNETKVNPQTGAIVEKDENGEYVEEVIGEFDYLWTIVNTVKAYTEIELEEIYIGLRIDKINNKLYS